MGNIHKVWMETAMLDANRNVWDRQKEGTPTWMMNHAAECDGKSFGKERGWFRSTFWRKQKQSIPRRTSLPWRDSKCAWSDFDHSGKCKMSSCTITQDRTQVCEQQKPLGNRVGLCCPIYHTAWIWPHRSNEECHSWTKFREDEEVIDEVKMWHRQNPGDIYQQGIRALVTRRRKTVEKHGHYVEKQCL